MSLNLKHVAPAKKHIPGWQELESMKASLLEKEGERVTMMSQATPNKVLKKSRVEQPPEKEVRGLATCDQNLCLVISVISL